MTKKSLLKQNEYNKRNFPCYNQSILKFIGTNQTILDIGCGDGSLGMEIKTKSNRVWGIDISSKAIRLAKRRLDKVFCTDIESDNLHFLPRQYFDLIILADVLEHLRNPDRVLLHMKRLLKKDGIIIISLPNIAYYTIRFELLLGRFKYRDLSILDPSHLRFFTQDTASEMFRDCGFKILKVDYSRQGWRKLITRLSPNLFTGQFIFILQP